MHPNLLHTTYISIGSNVGDKRAYLQQAIQQLSANVGRVVKISPIYETPAWGFEGSDFYNACLCIATALSPAEMMSEILEIEVTLGRVRSAKKGYQNRTIDIDIIFYEDESMQTDLLVLPHPLAHERKFVMQPLSDIAPSKIHPTYKKTVSQLNEMIVADGIQKSEETLQNPDGKKNFSRFNYIAIEGNIGAGKTSLATKIAEDFNGKLILERFADNPFLPKFYEDNSRYAFPLEMSFLADRYQQISDDLAQLDLFKDFIVSDYDVVKSLIFAKVTLQNEEYKLYRKLFDIMYKEIPKPDLYIYLYQNTERLLKNIKKRGRDYEQKIPSEYLEKINNGYLEFIRTHKDLNVKIIDVSDLDFVANANDYQKIISEIHEA
ncbi:2-amino-4-hydroxy-6-hydroxymethyldihydropteridine diphosphokinase [Kordia algicida OT-1]|uniref:2-amino-4-hydroxy-6-hydroxymethyldihydropteridine pyrophosphokinase n=1 Tax=Kordia algicida OT-1 TaxID=391587 RepID=A9DJW3_9FLAO|nr:2-amino-4-hydroxy-6-hydroxymethyldihydropteridine diphosphokinase [Kordia algicida]EDP98200.1 deoxyguanosine kinase/deoxyadenosine kinase subunit [Kordia algicida OT-1]